jgi:hypothetical protein
MYYKYIIQNNTLRHGETMTFMLKSTSFQQEDLFSEEVIETILRLTKSYGKIAFMIKNQKKP